MPTPRRGETRNEFVQRCIPEVIDDGTAQDPDQAVAVCESIWEDELSAAAGEETTTTTEPEWRAIHRAADTAVTPMARLVVRAMKAAQSEVRLKDLEDSVERGAVNLGVFDAMDVADQILRDDLPDMMFDVLVHGAFAAGRSSRAQGGFVRAEDPMQVVPGPIDRLAPVAEPLMAQDGLQTIFIPGQDGLPGFALTPEFETVNPEAVRWAQEKSSLDIVSISNGSRRAIRLAVTTAFVEGFPPLKAARNIRNLIGLTGDQQDAVAALESEMQRRVRGFVKRAGRQIGPRVPPGGYTQLQIDAAVRRYEDRLLAQRAINIARTETIASANEGQRQLWMQARRAGSLPDNIERIWIVTPDDLLCPVCRGMIGQRRSLTAAFSTGRFGPVLGPPAHPSCRCATGLVLKENTRRRR